MGDFNFHVVSDIFGLAMVGSSCMIDKRRFVEDFLHLDFERRLVTVLFRDMARLAITLVVAHPGPFFDWTCSADMGGSAIVGIARGTLELEFEGPPIKEGAGKDSEGGYDERGNEVAGLS